MVVFRKRPAPELSQIRMQKTNAVKPPMRCRRKRRDVTQKTRLQSLAAGLSRRQHIAALGSDSGA